MLKMGIETCNNSILALVTTDFNDNIFHTVLCLMVTAAMSKMYCYPKVRVQNETF